MKKYSILLPLLVATSLFAILPSLTAAPILGIQFGVAAAYSGTGVLGETFTQMESFPTMTGSDPLYTSGPLDIGSGLTLTFETTNASHGINGNANAEIVLYQGSFFSLNSPLTLTIGGLTPGTSYALAVYSDGTVNTSLQGGTGTMVSGAISGGPLASLTDPAITVGINALANMSAIADSSGNLSFTLTPTSGSSFVSISGIGLATVPEPNAVSLCFGGMLTLLGIYRLRRKSTPEQYL